MSPTVGLAQSGLCPMRRDRGDQCRVVLKNFVDTGTAEGDQLPADQRPAARVTAARRAAQSSGSTNIVLTMYGCYHGKTIGDSHDRDCQIKTESRTY